MSNEIKGLQAAQQEYDNKEPVYDCSPDTTPMLDKEPVYDCSPDTTPMLDKEPVYDCSPDTTPMLDKEPVYDCSPDTTPMLDKCNRAAEFIQAIYDEIHEEHWHKTGNLEEAQENLISLIKKAQSLQSQLKDYIEAT